MKKPAQYTLKSREEDVLKWLVRDYAVTGHPIGSSRLVEMECFEVGSATLRNVLHGLEHNGFLSQPYTSAGRVPTVKGYRYFVDRLMETVAPEDQIVCDFESGFEQMSVDLDLLIKNAAQFLGDMAQALVLISKPYKRASRIQSLALHEIGRDRILLIIQMSLDQVKTIAFEMKSQLSRTLLIESERLLNDLFAGMDIEEAQKLAEAPKDEVLTNNPIIKQIMSNLDGFLDSLSHNSEDFRVYGLHQLLQYPELAQDSGMESFVAAIETDVLQKTLPAPLAMDVPSILIGDEIGNSLLQNMSLISMSYRNNACSGEIHILGPTRMAYEKVTGLAQFTARKMKTFIDRTR